MALFGIYQRVSVFLKSGTLFKRKKIPQYTKWRTEELFRTSTPAVPSSHLRGTSGLGDTAGKTSDLHKLTLCSFALRDTHHHSKPVSASFPFPFSPSQPLKHPLFPALVPPPGLPLSCFFPLMCSYLLLQEWRTKLSLTPNSNRNPSLKFLPNFLHWN